MVEDKVNHLDGRVSKLEAVTDSIATSVKSLHDDITGLRKVIIDSTSNKPTNWGWVVTSFMAFISILTLALSPLLFLSVTNMNSAKESHEQFVAHIKDGHPYRVEQKANTNKEAIQSNGKNISRLEDKISKMMQEDAAMKMKIEVIERDIWSEEVDAYGSY